MLVGKHERMSDLLFNVIEQKLDNLAKHKIFFVFFDHLVLYHTKILHSKYIWKNQYFIRNQHQLNLARVNCMQNYLLTILTNLWSCRDSDLNKSVRLRSKKIEQSERSSLNEIWHDVSNITTFY